MTGTLPHSARFLLLWLVKLAHKHNFASTIAEQHRVAVIALKDKVNGLSCGRAGKI